MINLLGVLLLVGLPVPAVPLDCVDWAQRLHAAEAECRDRAERRGWTFAAMCKCFIPLRDHWSQRGLRCNLDVLSWP